MAMTLKKRIFVKEYLIDKNITRAAEAAGFAKRSAAQQGSRLMKDDDEVRAAIEKGLARELRYHEIKLAKAGVTKERWLEELAVVALANMDDHATIEAVKIGQGTRGKQRYVNTVVAVPTADRPRELGRVIKKISENKHGISIELHSKQSALETIGKHFGWIKSDFGIELPEGSQVVLTMPSNGREAPAPPEDAVNTNSQKEGKDGDGSSTT